jgi:hypothetical protein
MSAREAPLCPKWSLAFFYWQKSSQQEKRASPNAQIFFKPLITSNLQLAIRLKKSHWLHPDYKEGKQIPLQRTTNSHCKGVQWIGKCVNQSFIATTKYLRKTI